MIVSRCYVTSYATSKSSIKSQVLDLKTLLIFSPLKISVIRPRVAAASISLAIVAKYIQLSKIVKLIQ